MGSYGIGLAPGAGGARRAASRRARNRLARKRRSVRCPRGGVDGRGEDRQQAAAALDGAGKDVLLDDRDLRPGEKFADADLIGIPISVTAGKKSLEDGAVDVRDRASG